MLQQRVLRKIRPAPAHALFKQWRENDDAVLAWGDSFGIDRSLFEHGRFVRYQQQWRRVRRHVVTVDDDSLDDLLPYWWEKVRPGLPLTSAPFTAGQCLWADYAARLMVRTTSWFPPGGQWEQLGPSPSGGWAQWRAVWAVEDKISYVDDYAQLYWYDPDAPDNAARIDNVRTAPAGMYDTNENMTLYVVWRPRRTHDRVGPRLGQPGTRTGPRTDRRPRRRPGGRVAPRGRNQPHRRRHHPAPVHRLAAQAPRRPRRHLRRPGSVRHGRRRQPRRAPQSGSWLVAPATPVTPELHAGVAPPVDRTARRSRPGATAAENPG